MAETIRPIPHTFGTCAVDITGHKQDGDDVDPDDLDRRLDLVVIGTADPNSENMSGSITIDGQSTDLAVTFGRPLAAMDWTCTVSHDLYVDSSDPMAILLFTKKCGDGSIALALDPIKFRN